MTSKLRIGIIGVGQIGKAHLDNYAKLSEQVELVAAADVNAGDEFFTRLAAHWKSHYAGWSAWLLTPDSKLPGRLRLKESRRVPLWNGPIECRLLRFDLTARRGPAAP